MRAIWTLAGAVLLFAAMEAHTQASAQTPQILIFGGSGHRDFLGCLNCGETDSSSVWNDISKYGWQNDIGVWNDISPYGNSFGPQSACNDIANDPPVLVDRQGNFYGRLSINELVTGSVCGLQGNEQICRAVKVMCAGH